MAGRRIAVAGEQWDVFPSGWVTVYDRDEFGLVFQQGTGPDRIRRYVRYSPTGSRYRETSLAELSDAQLVELLRHAQGEWTSPEGRAAERASAQGVRS
jgi:hypothetical protein